MPQPRPPRSNDDEALEGELLLLVDGGLDAERRSAIEARAAEQPDLARRIALIRAGRDRMREYLKKLAYADDTFEGDLTMFWLNGDLVVSPEEQLRFVGRLAQYALPVDRHRVDAVKAAFLMPPGKITNASGIHDFRLGWPEPVAVRAKTGNTTVGEERVSWLVGHLEARNRQYVFVSRVRATETLSGMAGADLAVQALNAHRPTRR